MEISKKETIWYMFFEGLMSLNYMIALPIIIHGSLINKPILIFLGCVNLVAGLLCFGMVVLYTAKYNIKPFFYRWLPKKIKEEFP